MALSEDVIAAASQAAKIKNKEGEWLFTLQMASYIPFMTYSKKRHLRETLFKAYGGCVMVENLTIIVLLQR